MSLTFLGLRTIRPENDWVAFNPIALKGDKGYYLEASFNNSNQLQPFSYFNFGYQFQIKEGSLVTLTLANNYYPDSRTHAIVVPGIQELDKATPVVFLCRRVQTVVGFSTIADISVSLSLDPDINF